nr:MAG TPA: hypothetical protein [Caudoviricetes sp.]
MARLQDGRFGKQGVDPGRNQFSASVEKHHSPVITAGYVADRMTRDTHGLGNNFVRHVSFFQEVAHIQDQFLPFRLQVVHLPVGAPSLIDKAAVVVGPAKETVHSLVIATVIRDGVQQVQHPAPKLLGNRSARQHGDKVAAAQGKDTGLRRRIAAEGPGGLGTISAPKPHRPGELNKTRHAVRKFVGMAAVKSGYFSFLGVTERAGKVRGAKPYLPIFAHDKQFGLLKDEVRHGRASRRSGKKEGNRHGTPLVFTRLPGAVNRQSAAGLFPRRVLY